MKANIRQTEGGFYKHSKQGNVSVVEFSEDGNFDIETASESCDNDFEMFINDSSRTKREKIKILFELNFSKADIAELLDTHYSFVHQTLSK